MTTVKHSERAHALLSASGASRWINCPPSALEEDVIPETGSSDFAKEGTVAHELAEAYLSKELRLIDKTKFEKLVSVCHDDLIELQGSDANWAEMLGYVGSFCDMVMEQVEKSATETGSRPYVGLEVRLDLTTYIEEGFCTGDVIIIDDNTLHIIDLKYGKGVRVDAPNNPQLRIYALGADDLFSALYSYTSVNMVIIQPRLNHYSNEVMHIDELRSWAAATLKPAADKAFAGEGDHTTGPWCKWCKVQATCKTLSGEALQTAQAEFKGDNKLTNKEMAGIFSKIDTVESWVKSFKKHMLDTAIAGEKYEGFKLVEGRSIRKVKDENGLTSKLCDSGPVETDELYNKKLKGLGDLEKMFGKKEFNALAKDFIHKPAGSPTLVPTTDKRAEWSPDDPADEFK